MLFHVLDDRFEPDWAPFESVDTDWMGREVVDTEQTTPLVAGRWVRLELALVDKH